MYPGGTVAGSTVMCPVCHPEGARRSDATKRESKGPEDVSSAML